MLVERRDGGEERVQTVERDLVREFAEARGREPFGCLRRFVWRHPRRHCGEAVEVIDVAE